MSPPLSKKRKVTACSTDPHQHVLGGFFPTDITVNILARLPLKTLLRFKLVCKSWQRLITMDKHFINLQFRSSSHEEDQSIALVIPYFFRLPSDYDLAFDFQLNKIVPAPSLQFIDCAAIIMSSSSHGLLCCRDSEIKNLYYVCNPSTRKFRTLPKSPCFPAHRRMPTLGLVFYSSTLNFKVFFLEIKNLDKGLCYFCGLFDSEKDFWLHYQLPAIPKSSSSCLGVYVKPIFSNGCFYICNPERSVSVLPVLSLRDFDATTKLGEWRNILFPSKIVAGRYLDKWLLNHEDSIFLVSFSGSYRMDVWCLCEDQDKDEQWRILADNVDCNYFGARMGYYLWPFAINFDSVCLSWNSEFCRVYNMRNKMWHNVEIGRGTSISQCVNVTHSFKGSLFSIACPS